MALSKDIQDLNLNYNARIDLERFLLDNFGLLKNILSGTITASSDPTVNDDETNGYAIFNLWLNISDNGLFICLDPSDGAAVWQEVSVFSPGAGAILDSLFDANTILKADSDNTPVALTIAEQRLIGRITGGVITGLTATQIRTLINVEDGAEANNVDSVNGQTGIVVLDPDDLNDAATTNKFTTAGDISKLAGIESGAEANTVDSVNTKTGVVVLDPDDLDDTSTVHKFTSASDISKLANIEANADVTDAANVNTAGAVMESDFDANTILAANSDNIPLPLTVAEQRIVGRITGNNIDDLTAAQVRTLLNIEDGAQVNTVDSVNGQTGTVVLDPDDLNDAAATNKFTTASDISKLAGIENNATADQSDSEIETAYNNQVSVVSQAEAEAGSSTTVRRWTAERVKQAIAALAGGGATPAFENYLLHVRDEKSAGVNGGTFTAGAWRTRDVNTVKTNEISGASLSSNQITLPAGTYFIMASAPAYNLSIHKAKLRNVTDGSDVIIGTSEYNVSTVQVQTRSFVLGRFTIAASKAFEIQHYASVTISTTGFGWASNFSVVEVYTEVFIWKVA